MNEVDHVSDSRLGPDAARAGARSFSVAGGVDRGLAGGMRFDFSSPFALAEVCGKLAVVVGDGGVPSGDLGLVAGEF
jgi:hypothetical protein